MATCRAALLLVDQHYQGAVVSSSTQRCKGVVVSLVEQHCYALLGNSPLWVFLEFWVPVLEYVCFFGFLYTLETFPKYPTTSWLSCFWFDLFILIKVESSSCRFWKLSLVHLFFVCSSAPLCSSITTRISSPWRLESISFVSLGFWGIGWRFGKQVKIALCKDFYWFLFTLPLVVCFDPLIGVRAC